MVKRLVTDVSEDPRVLDVSATTTRHGVTYQNVRIFRKTAVRTWRSHIFNNFWYISIVHRRNTYHDNTACSHTEDENWISEYRRRSILNLEISIGNIPAHISALINPKSVAGRPQSVCWNRLRAGGVTLCGHFLTCYYVVKFYCDSIFGPIIIAISIHRAEFINCMFFTLPYISPPPQWCCSPPVGQGLPIIKASRSHSDTSHSVELLWTRDQPNTETSTWQHTTLTSDNTATSPPGFQPAIPAREWSADPRLRPRGRWDRHIVLYTAINSGRKTHCACGTYGKEQMCLPAWFLVGEDLKEWGHLEDVGIYGKIILKGVGKKWVRKTWNGQIWLRIGTNGGLLRIRPWKSVLYATGAVPV
jgi:hypothetical protein